MDSKASTEREREEDPEDVMIEKMARFMEKCGLVFASKDDIDCDKRDRSFNEQQSTGNHPYVPPKYPIQESHLEETIYKRAVPLEKTKSVMSKRDSSSSEEPIDTSDENLDSAALFINSAKNNVVVEWQTDHETERVLHRRSSTREPQPHCSRDEGHREVPSHEPDPEAEVHQQIGDLVRAAERSRARIYDVAGKDINQVNTTLGKVLHQHELFHLVIVDEDYLVVATHLDEGTKRKIILGKYVDFAKLIPHGRINSEEDHRMEMVNYNGHSFWVPAADHNAIVITNFSKWEQAFRVYSNVYTKKHPSRSSELIQYNHIIHTASLRFAWENVYLYDKEFRMHLSHYPERSWSVILQQAWTMYLKDRLPSNNSEQQSSHQTGHFKSKKICFDFNSGYC